MEDCSKTTEEMNLVRKIEDRTKNLMQSLNSIENITKGLNKSLLPEELKKGSEGKTESKAPQGWLECHLADLDHVLWRSKQIHDEVIRLMQATRIDKVGQ